MLLRTQRDVSVSSRGPLHCITTVLSALAPMGILGSAKHAADGGTGTFHYRHVS